MTIEAEYNARVKYDIVSGENNDFLMIDEQDFVYLGTEEEYKEFIKDNQ